MEKGLIKLLMMEVMLPSSAFKDLQLKKPISKLDSLSNPQGKVEKINIGLEKQ